MEAMMDERWVGASIPISEELLTVLQDSEALAKFEQEVKRDFLRGFALETDHYMTGEPMDELRVIRKVLNIFNELDVETRVRVLQYVTNKISHDKAIADLNAARTVPVS
jgi:hypothetical protein